MSRNLIINRLYSSKNNHEKQSINQNNQKNKYNHDCGYDKYQNYQLLESTGIKASKSKHAPFFNNNNKNNSHINININSNQFLQQSLQSLQSTPSEFEIPNPQKQNQSQKQKQKQNQKKNNFYKAFFDNFQTNCQIVYSKVKINTNSQNQKCLQRKLENQLISLIHRQPQHQSQIIQNNRFSSSNTIITSHQNQNAINNNNNNDDNNEESNFNVIERHINTNNHYKNQPYQQQPSQEYLSRQKKTRHLRHSGISLVQITCNNQPKSKNRLLYNKNVYLNRNQSQIQLEYYKQEKQSQTKRNYIQLQSNNQVYPYLKAKNDINKNKNVQPNNNSNSLLLKNSGDNFNKYSVLDIRRKYQMQNQKQKEKLKQNQENSRRKLYHIKNHHPIQCQYQYSKSHLNFESQGYQSVKSIKNENESEIIKKNENQLKIKTREQEKRIKKTQKIYNQIQQGNPSFPSTSTRHFYFNQQLVKAKSLKTQPANQESIKRAQHSRLAYYRRQRQLKLRQVNNSRSKNINGVRILTQRSWQNPNIQSKHYDHKYQRQLQQLKQKKQKRNDSNLQNQFSQRYLIKSFQNYSHQNQSQRDHRILLQKQQQKQNNFIYVNKNRNHNLNGQNEKITNLNLRKDKYIQRESRQSQRLKSIHNQLNNIYQINKFQYPLKEAKPKLVIQQKRSLNQITKEERPTLKKVGSIIRF